MPLFECLRCNALSYSSATEPTACDVCGETSRRTLGHEASFQAAAQRPRTLGAGDHAALMYGDDRDGADAVAALVDAAPKACSLIVGHVPDSVLGLLPDDVCRRVRWVGEEHAYPEGFRPEATVERYRDIIAAEPGTTMVLSGPTRRTAEFSSLEDWRRYERLVHEEAVRTGAIVVCVYDERLHDDQTLDLCRVCHPLLVGRAVRRNPAFSWAPAA